MEVAMTMLKGLGAFLAFASVCMLFFGDSKNEVHQANAVLWAIGLLLAFVYGLGLIVESFK